jgi:hypothetical protein
MFSIYTVDIHKSYIQVSQERSMFWEVTVSIILSKKVYMYTCPVQLQNC